MRKVLDILPSILMVVGGFIMFAGSLIMSSFESILIPVIVINSGAVLVLSMTAIIWRKYEL